MCAKKMIDYPYEKVFNEIGRLSIINDEMKEKCQYQ